MPILITNGKIFCNNQLIEKSILIDKGKIKKILPKNKIVKADKVIDAKNKIIIPGEIDCHVHFRDPGLTHKGDFLSESRAAAKGGITTVLDMPNTLPPTTTVEALEEKRKLAAKSVVNYGFHFGAFLNNINEIKKIKNIASVKLYMDCTTGDLKIDDHDYIVNLLKTSKTTTIHAERENINNIVDLAKKNNIINKIYFCHVSSEKELKYAKLNRLDKIKNKVFVEVTPHHLFLNEKDIQKLGAFAEMKPRLNTEKDQKALWLGIKNEIVDVIATDHAPHTKEEKQQPNYPFGVPGLETMLPLLLDAYNNKKIELKKIIKLCCENPAKIFNIKNKGFIKVGFDADLTIVDLNLKKEVKNEELLTKCGWSPFDGKILKGWPVITIVNGNVVYGDGKIYDVKGGEVKYS